MTKKRNQTPLTAAKVKATTKPGWYSDTPKTPGFFLVVAPGGSKSWAQRIMFNGKYMGVGLGPVRDVTLADARLAAQANRLLVRKGEPPVSYRRADRAKTAPQGEQFADFIAPTIAMKGLSENSASSMRSRLNKYAGRILPLSVSAISTQDVLDAVQPLWPSPTGKLLLRHIALVMAHAIGLGKREGNPAETAKGMLSQNGHKTKHHAALPHGEVGAALATIAKAKAMESARLAMRFLALTATRSAEVRGALWQEIDLAAKVWVIPASRMKADRGHTVPLSRQALEVLEAAKEAYGDTGLVFPGKTGGVIDNQTLLNLVKPFGVTVHGFRSSIRDWAAETGVAREVAEACLAHTEQDKTVAAYKRTDLLEQRQGVMQAWADYLDC